MLAAEVLIKLTDGVNHAGFRSHGDYPLHVGFYFTTMLLQMLAVWALALSGYGPLAAAAAFAGIRALVTPCSAMWLLRRHRDLHLGFEHARRAELKRLAKPALANLSMPLAMALNIQGMVLVVGAILGPLAVVVFATLRTLTRVALQAVWQVAHAFEPELASAWGIGDKALLRRLYLSAQRGGFWLALAAAITLWLAGPWILSVWTHGKVAMNLPLFSWLLLSAVASVLWYCALNLLKAGNIHLRATLWYALSAAASVILAIVLLRTTHRVADAGLALLLTDALMASYLLRSAARVLGTTVRDLIGSTLDPRPLMLNFNRAMIKPYIAHASTALM
ncbi:MAG: lipopolysaccharide biosynthesis protein [Metallibacterium sp.]